MRNRTSRLWGAVAASLAIACLALTGCTSVTEATASRAGDIKLPMTVPATFTDGAIWKADRASKAPVIVTPLGILTLTATDKADTYSPVLLAPDTGKERWTGKGVKASDALPSLAWVESDNRSWAILTVRDKTANTTTVYSYDALASHPGMPPTSTATFTGATAETPPSVVVSATDIMVAHSTAGGYLQYHPATGTTTVLSTAPTRGGEPGTPVLVYDGGWLVSYKDIGFGYATTAGGWESDNHVPTGAVPGGERMLQTGAGYVVTLWTGTAKDTQVLALQDIQDGSVVATMTVADSATAGLLHEQIANTAKPRHLVADGTWVTWGGFAFDLGKHAGKTISIANGVPVAIIQGMVYAWGADRPLTGPDSTPTPEPSATPTPTVSATPTPIKGFSGNVAVDLSSGTPMPTPFTACPQGVSSYGQGIFAYGDAIYAVPLR